MVFLRTKCYNVTARLQRQYTYTRINFFSHYVSLLTCTKFKLELVEDKWICTW